MAQLTGSEFSNEKGTQGSLLKWIWSKIYIYFNVISTYFENALAPITQNIATLQGGLADELVARANGDTVLQNALNTLIAQVVGLKTITPWDPTAAFPAVRIDGQPFSKVNYVQITVSNGQYKAGDMLICTADGATTVDGFGDVDFNVDIATDAVYGTVKLIASLAEYNGIDPTTGSKVITKGVLQAILQEVTGVITTAYQTADTALQTAITTAYQTAIATELGNYYTKPEIDGFVNTINAAIAQKANKTAVVTGLNAVKDALLAVLKDFEKRRMHTYSHSLNDWANAGDGTSEGMPNDFSFRTGLSYFYELPKIHDIKNLRVGGISLSVKTVDLASYTNYEMFSLIPSAVCANKNDYDVVVLRWTEIDANNRKTCGLQLFFNNLIFTDDTIMSDGSLLVISESCPFNEDTMDFLIDQAMGTTVSTGLAGLS